MMHRIRKHTISVKHAFDGMMWAINTQPNYLIHATLSLVSVIASIILKVSYAEFLVILALITGGLAFETMNTAIEKVCDAVTRDYNEDIKIAKDVAAGAMLMYAIGSATVAVIIFLPKFLNLFGYN